MKVKKIFFDANIFNDIFDEKRVKHESSKFALLYAIQNDIEICTSCDIVTNIYYITAKYTSNEKALQALTYIKEIVNILAFSKDELDKTIEIMREDSDYKDMEDTIQYVLALQEECDIILSNDKKFTSKEITLMSSDEYMKNR